MGARLRVPLVANLNADYFCGNATKPFRESVASPYAKFLRIAWLEWLFVPQAVSRIADQYGVIGLFEDGLAVSIR